MTRVVHLNLEQLTALERVKAGQVRHGISGFRPDVFGPFVVYDALSTLPAPAVAIIFGELRDLDLIVIEDGMVRLTETGAGAYGTARVVVG
jgi:hypothetical protein